MLKNSVNYVYQVYQEKSFSKAAQKLFISQPALSAAIQKEEAVWRCAFFDRSTNPIELTPEGREFIAAIERIKEIQRELETCFEARTQTRQHTLNIDACLTVQTWPNSVFKTTAIGEEEVILAVPASCPMNKKLSEYQLGPDDIKNASRLRDDCPRVSICEFKDMPFLLLKQGNDMYSRAMKICRQSGFTPNAFVTLAQLLTSYHMAAAGMGIAFIRAGLMNYADGNVCYYALDSEDTIRSINLVCKKNRVLPVTVQNFLSYLSHYDR